MPRSVRDFALTNVTWWQIDVWAAQQGFRLTDTSAVGRTYEKVLILTSRSLSDDWVSAPVTVSLANTANNGVHLEAWVRLSAYLRFGWLFLAPAELNLEHTFVAWVTRKRARDIVNPLLTSLGQPEIV